MHTDQLSTPVAFVPRYIEPSSVFSGGDSSLETNINVPSGAVPPTLIISHPIPIEFCEMIERGDAQAATPHHWYNLLRR
jgi:hypothetical protein